MSSGRTWSFQKSCGRSAWSCSQPGEREREGRVKHFCLRVGGTWSAGGQGETQRRRDSPMAEQGSSPARRDCTRCALCWCRFCALIPAAPCSAPGRRSGSPTAGGGGNDRANRHIDWSPRGLRSQFGAGKRSPYLHVRRRGEREVLLQTEREIRFRMFNVLFPFYLQQP